MSTTTAAWNKVARITAIFWVLKIAATTLGETAGDLLSKEEGLNLGYQTSSIILFSVLAVLLAAQLAARRFHPVLYWAVILATSTVGTTMSDYMDRTLKLGYMTGSIILASLLLLTLAIWRWTVGTLSVENVRSLRVELFYWVAIIFSNTLGTALGDFLADDSGLGFAGGAAVIGGCLLVILLLYFFTSLSRVLLFWLAFVLTRPFGATFGDVLSRDHDEGGLGFGTRGSSAVLLGILIVVLAWSIWRERTAKPLADASRSV